MWNCISNGSMKESTQELGRIFCGTVPATSTMEQQERIKELESVLADIREMCTRIIKALTECDITRVIAESDYMALLDNDFCLLRLRRHGQWLGVRNATLRRQLCRFVHTVKFPPNTESIADAARIVRDCQDMLATLIADIDKLFPLERDYILWCRHMALAAAANNREVTLAGHVVTLHEEMDFCRDDDANLEQIYSLLRYVDQPDAT